jgi:DNA-binding NtrC family response regulator
MKNLKNLSIMLVEDEPKLRREIAAFLEMYCDRVTEAADGLEALERFTAQPSDLVISDIRMPKMNGLELAARLKELSPETPVILCTAFTETSYLLKAIELGVVAIVRKPLDMDELLGKIGAATAHIIQQYEINSLSSGLAASITAQLGAGSAMEAISEQVARAASTPFNLLLQGETGSGKSFLAGIIHQLSSCRNGPFVSVQMAAMPEHLAEGQLFGHVRGAFTDAVQPMVGLVESAQGGTLFLDDVETCPLRIQTKLLRLVEEKRYMALGNATEKTCDVRIISASNRNLSQEVKSGRFREDLYYRLADVVITMQPLRDMRDAIIPLAVRFLQDTCWVIGRAVPLLDKGAQSMLTDSGWPGNIRQLKSVIRRILINADDVVTAPSIAAAIQAGDRGDLPKPVLANLFQSPCPPPFPCSMDALEKWSFEQALDFCGGKRMRTASMLGMNYSTFKRRLKKHGVILGQDEQEDL